MKEVRVYVPSKDCDGRDLLPELVAWMLTITLSNMVTWYGGATDTPGNGHWDENDGNMLDESVTIVSSYTTEEKLAQYRPQLEGLGEMIKGASRQQAVMVAILPVDEVLFI